MRDHLGGAPDHVADVAALADLARSYGTEFALRLPQWEWLGAFVVGVALLGALSARWSVTRNTRF